MKTVRVGLLVPAALLAVVVAGCGSSSSSSSSSTAAAAAPTTTQSAATSSASGGSTVLVGTKKAKKLGPILDAGSKHMTVYLFEADKGGKSACSAACAAVWPPVLGSGKAIAGAEASNLGTIMRSDGRTQVTYKGHPLYFFIKDKDGGDAYGQGAKAFGASWYVLKPSGSKLDNT